MSKTGVIEVEGEVIETFPSALFKVKLENDHEVLCHPSGKIRQNNIKILLGDRVLVEMSTYDFSKGRIIYRYR